MALEIFSPQDANKWNDIIDRSTNGTLYHNWEWLKIVEKYSNSKLYPLVFFNDSDPNAFGAIPIFLMTKFGFKMVFSPPPGSEITLGPVFIDNGYNQHRFELAYQEFQSKIDNFIRGIGVHYTSFLTSPGLLDMRPFSWAHYQVTPTYTYKIDLSQGEEVVWGKMSKYLRKNIKSAQKKGITIVKSIDNDTIDYIYNSLNKRYENQNLNLSLQKMYLRDLIERFGSKSIKMFLAVYNERPMGALLCTVYKDKTTAWIGAVRNQSNELESNELIHWEAINSAIHDGFKWFEIMGANTRNLCEFKAKFYPQIDVYFRVKKSGLLGSLAEKTYFILQKRPHWLA